MTKGINWEANNYEQLVTLNRIIHQFTLPGQKNSLQRYLPHTLKKQTMAAVKKKFENKLRLVELDQIR